MVSISPVRCSKPQLNNHNHEKWGTENEINRAVCSLMLLVVELANGDAACAGLDLKGRFVGVVLVQYLRRIQQVRCHLKQKGMTSQQPCTQNR